MIKVLHFCLFVHRFCRSLPHMNYVRERCWRQVSEAIVSIVKMSADIDSYNHIGLWWYDNTQLLSGQTFVGFKSLACSWNAHFPILVFHFGLIRWFMVCSSSYVFMAVIMVDSIIWHIKYLLSRKNVLILVEDVPGWLVAISMLNEPAFRHVKTHTVP